MKKLIAVAILFMVFWQILFVAAVWVEWRLESLPKLRMLDAVPHPFFSWIKSSDLKLSWSWRLGVGGYLSGVDFIKLLLRAAVTGGIVGISIYYLSNYSCKSFVRQRIVIYVLLGTFVLVCYPVLAWWWVNTLGNNTISSACWWHRNLLDLTPGIEYCIVAWLLGCLPLLVCMIRPWKRYCFNGHQ